VSEDPEIRFTANGTERGIAPGSRIPDLLDSLGLPPSQVVIERNGEALTRDEASAATIEPGDRIEIVRIVAGG